MCYFLFDFPDGESKIWANITKAFDVPGDECGGGEGLSGALEPIQVVPGRLGQPGHLHQQIQQLSSSFFHLNIVSKNIHVYLIIKLFVYMYNFYFLSIYLYIDIFVLLFSFIFCSAPSELYHSLKAAKICRIIKSFKVILKKLYEMDMRINPLRKCSIKIVLKLFLKFHVEAGGLRMVLLVLTHCQLTTIIPESLRLSMVWLLGDHYKHGTLTLTSRPLTHTHTQTHTQVTGERN